MRKEVFEVNDNNIYKYKQKNGHVSVCDRNETSRSRSSQNKSDLNGYKQYVQIVSEYLHVVLPACAALLCYMNGFHGDFVHDDLLAIKNNPDVIGDGDIVRMFLNDFWGKPMESNASHKSYRPFTVLTFRFNYLLTGLQPFYFHMVNVMLHVLVTSLFCITCQNVLLVSKSICCMAGMLFAVHPIHTEAVTGLVGRADVMAAMFFLFSFLAYQRSTRGGKADVTSVPDKRFFILSLILAAAAMLSKETGATVLGVCLLFDGGAVVKRNIARYPSASCDLSLRCFVFRCAAVLCYTTVLLLSRAQIMAFSLPHFNYYDNPASFQSSLLTRLLSYGYIWSHNVWMLLAPDRLCYDWQNLSIPLVTSVRDVRNVTTLTTALVVVWLGYSAVCRCALPGQRQHYVDPLFSSLVLMIIPFLPASNLFFRVGFVLAERVLYIPSMGYCLLVALGMERLCSRLPGHARLVTTIFYGLLLLHGGKTWQQNTVWQSRETLFRSGVEVMPHNTKVHYNYANYLKDVGRRDEAIFHYRETLRMDNTYASAYNNLGTLLENKDEAIHLFRKTLELVPFHHGAHINLGASLCKLGKTTEGLPYLHKAVEMEPNNPEALTSLASGLMMVGNDTGSEHYARKAIHIKPNIQEAHVVIGKLHEQRGQHQESVTWFRRAHDLDTSNHLPLVYAAQSYNKLGLVTTAETLLKEALTIRRDVTALEQLALLYYHLGRHAESLAMYQEVMDLAPNTTVARLRYGKVKATSGDYPGALSEFQSLLTTEPDNPAVLYAAGQVLAALGQHDMAIEYYDRCLTLLNNTNTSDVDIIDVISNRANSYRDVQQYIMALHDCLTVLSKRPYHVTCHANVGTIYHLQGELEKAEYHYDEVLRYDPDTHIVRDNLIKLRRQMTSQSGAND